MAIDDQQMPIEGGKMAIDDLKMPIDGNLLSVGVSLSILLK